jgi:hypothetical protein
MTGRNKELVTMWQGHEFMHTVQKLLNPSVNDIKPEDDNCNVCRNVPHQGFSAPCSLQTYIRIFPPEPICSVQ